MTVLRRSDRPPRHRPGRRPVRLRDQKCARCSGYDSRADVPDDSDEHLMLRYQQGDEAAFRLILRYGAAIYRYFCTALVATTWPVTAPRRRG